MTDTVLSDLIHLLDQQVDLYRSMETVLSKEKNAVINADMDAMNAAGNDKALLIREIGSLEERRLKLLEKLAVTLNCPVQTLRLKQLARMVPEPFSIRLKDTYRHLLGVTQRVRTINRAYQAAITQALNFTRESISFISGMVTPHSTYHATGKMQNRKQSGMYMSGKI